ncbi:hypothetical protein ACFLIM_48010 [Nonomuraea sp. M3C6]|uniref:Uncharacterized protein n=1 Tax=Nonomuraea marmarensis TaxID=3351344 RepID=A0ABW7AXJ2_9ACTN
MRVPYVADGACSSCHVVGSPTTEVVWTAHPEHLDISGSLVASIGGLLVENGDRALLIRLE